MKLVNAVSINMLPQEGGRLVYQPLPLEEAREIAQGVGVQSAVGHPDTANIFAKLLGVDVPPNRATISLGYGERAILGQYIGPRLPEGATALPEGATIRWYLIWVEPLREE